MKLNFRRTIAGWLLPLLLVAIATIAVTIYPQAVLADDFTKATLGSMDFSDKDLTSFEFTQASVRGGKFVNSNMTGVSLIGGDFDSADFSGANLTNAALDTTRLTRTNLTNTNFEKSFHPKVKLDNAIGIEFSYLEDRRLFDIYNEILFALE